MLLSRIVLLVVVVEAVAAITALDNQTKGTRTRIGWPYVLRSAMARRIARHQSNCSMPSASYGMNHAGLGSDLHVWGQTLCGVMEEGHRLETQGHWDWADEGHCGPSNLLGCYFPVEERHCQSKSSESAQKSKGCPSIIHNDASKNRYRAAATEYLFSKGFAPFVQDEITQQMQRIFGAPVVPNQLITVHIRWGDKASEMVLVPVENYVQAVKTLLMKRRHKIPVHIYVATEDPSATAAFRKASPPDWVVYGDAMVSKMSAFRPKHGNHALKAALESHGYAGTVALASLAIAMEANEFVLTTGSNWSRLMDELRRNVIDPRCGECTAMIDLRKGQWR